MHAAWKGHGRMTCSCCQAASLRYPLMGSLRPVLHGPSTCFCNLYYLLCARVVMPTQPPRCMELEGSSAGYAGASHSCMRCLACTASLLAVAALCLDLVPCWGLLEKERPVVMHDPVHCRTPHAENGGRHGPVVWVGVAQARGRAAPLPAPAPFRRLGRSALAPARPWSRYGSSSGPPPSSLPPSTPPSSSSELDACGVCRRMHTTWARRQAHRLPAVHRGCTRTARPKSCSGLHVMPLPHRPRALLLAAGAA
jgi:hypothetical protein